MIETGVGSASPGTPKKGVLMQLRRLVRSLTLAAFGSALLMVPAAADEWSVRTDDSWCDEQSGHRYCEVREMTVAAPRQLSVIPGKNGGVKIEGWDRSEVRIEAKVSVWENRRRSAAHLVDAIRIDTGGGEIRVDGPDRDDVGWSVSFRIRVPRRSDLRLETHNGGIGIEGVNGEIEFEAMNGGVSLQHVGGDVRGRTVNGGITVRLEGYSWDGEGLDVRTTNGGVKLYIPEGYNTELTTGTVNGSLRTDIPLLVRGDLSKRIRTTLGSGGPPISVVTTNGGVRLSR